MITRRHLLTLLTGSVSVFIAGCSRLRKPPLGKIQVQLVDVRPPNIGLTSATIPIILEFYNPAGRPIPDISGDVDVYINNKRAGSDEITVNRLEPQEKTRYQVDFVVKFSAVGKAIIDAIRSQSFSVRLEGELNAGGATRTIEVSTRN